MKNVTFYNKKGIKVFIWFILISFIITLMPIPGDSQTKKTLSQMLWERVKKCYSKFVDEDGNGKPDCTIIDDSKNGYLQVSGSYPECGCECTSTVGAYVNKSGEYIFLQSEIFTCSWEKRIYSNKNLNELLPKDFDISTFISQPIKEKINYLS